MDFFNISEYIEAKTQWENVHTIIHPDGHATVKVKGEQFPLSEYLQQNSKPNYMPPIPQNPDGKTVQGGHVTRKKR